MPCGAYARPSLITNPGNSANGWGTTIDGPGWTIPTPSSGDSTYVTWAGLPFPSICTYEALFITPAVVSFLGICDTTDGTIRNATHERALFTTGGSGLTLTAYIYDGGVKTAAGPNLTGSTRYHVVFTADGTNLTLYTDGVQVGQTAAGAAYTGYTTPSTYFGVGQNTIPTLQGFVGGTLLTFGLWSRALTATEVRALYQAPWDMTRVPGRIMSRLSQPASTATVTTVQRRTLSLLGARVGSRQAR